MGIWDDIFWKVTRKFLIQNSPKIPFHAQKINLLRFWPNFFHVIIAFHEFQIPLKFLWYLFSFSSYGVKIGLQIFRIVNIFKFLIFNFHSAKRAPPLEFECVWIFLCLAPFKRYFFSKFNFLTVRTTFSSFFGAKFDYCTKTGVEWAVSKINYCSSAFFPRKLMQQTSLLRRFEWNWMFINSVA